MFDHIGGWSGFAGCMLGCVVLVLVAGVFQFSETAGWVALLGGCAIAWPYTGWGRK